jgi:hypothetical protein
MRRLVAGGSTPKSVNNMDFSREKLATNGMAGRQAPHKLAQNVGHLALWAL